MALVLQPGMNSPLRPRVSVCVANYNGEHLLPACIDSVLAQDTDAAIEILVHDDASSDASLTLLRERYPQVNVLASSMNAGFCVGNNRMVSRARGDYVLLLNNDAALHPDAIRSLLDASDPQIPEILTLPQYDWESGQLVDRGCLLDPFCNPIPNLDPSRDHIAYVIGACLWCPRDTWHALGGLPEWMESIGEDLYFCGLARLRGIPIRALTSSGYRHRQGASFGGNRIARVGLQTTVKRRRLSERNKTRSLMVLTPGPAMWALLAAHVCALALEGAALSIARGDLALWRDIYAPAFATPFREAGVLLATRREVQATRRIRAPAWFKAVSWQPRKLALLMRYGIPDVR